MLNFYKLIEILVSLQSIIISTMIPLYIQLPLINESSNSFDKTITMINEHRIVIGVDNYNHYKQILNFKINKNLKYKYLSSNKLNLIDPRRWS